jgi:hypothetical protein
MKKIIFIGNLFLAFIAFSVIGCSNANYAETSKSTASAPEYNALKMLNYQDIPELVYKVEPRFLSRIAKTDLLNARSVLDIFPKKATQSITTFKTSEIAIVDGNGKDEVLEYGESGVLNEAQLALIKDIEYSTNFFLRAYYERIDEYSGRPFNEHIIYYMTVVPENEAMYAEGQEALISYLKTQSIEATRVIDYDKLEPGRVNFTVTREGNITGVKLNSTSGYPSVDEKLVEIVTNMPGKWHPATNAEGEKVDQELVFFFGRDGC